MSLRLQLMVLSLLTLVIPWTGCQYVKQMERSLRSGLAQSQLATARTIAARVRDQPQLLYADPGETRADAVPEGIIYAQRLTTTPRIDGYLDDWGTSPAAPRAIDQSSHTYRAATDGRYLYLFFDIVRSPLRYEAPGEHPGDRIVLAVRAASGQQAEVLVLATAAPGTLGARLGGRDFLPTSRREDRVFGAWVETAHGAQVEVRVPLELTRYGIGLGFVAGDPGSGPRIQATWRLGSLPGPLKSIRGPLESALAELRPVGARLRVVDVHGYVLADLGSVSELDSRLTGTLAERFYRWLLTTPDPDYGSFAARDGRIEEPSLSETLAGRPRSWWLKASSSPSAIVVAGQPVTAAGNVIGAVLLEQASEGILTLTNEALTQLMNATLLASLVAAVSLLAFATYLSFRVRRLAAAARRALNARGELQTRLPGQGSADELGDLARSFADLLHRLEAYTGYLKSLGSKLSHELRTPIAVVTTSAENLDAEIQSESARVFLKRLQRGAARLEHIVASMSEATRIEQAIQDSERQSFQLKPLLEQSVQSYQSIHPSQRFRFVCDIDRVGLTGSPELLAQLVDKLVDNAVEFTPPDGRIEVRLDASGDGWRLSVANQGPPLPRGMREQLFDSLVSVREGRSEQPHLGLGLFIVRLIAEFHGGHVEAANSDDPAGSVFHVYLPRGQDP
jgi:two-component system sensor histidine kinase ChvG